SLPTRRPTPVVWPGPMVRPMPGGRAPDRRDPTPLARLEAPSPTRTCPFAHPEGEWEAIPLRAGRGVPYRIDIGLFRPLGGRDGRSRGLAGRESGRLRGFRSRSPTRRAKRPKTELVAKRERCRWPGQPPPPTGPVGGS